MPTPYTETPTLLLEFELLSRSIRKTDENILICMRDIAHMLRRQSRRRVEYERQLRRVLRQTKDHRPETLDPDACCENCRHWVQSPEQRERGCCVNIEASTHMWTYADASCLHWQAIPSTRSTWSTEAPTEAEGF